MSNFGDFLDISYSYLDRLHSFRFARKYESEEKELFIFADSVSIKESRRVYKKLDEHHRHSSIYVRNSPNEKLDSDEGLIVYNYIYGGTRKL